MLLFIKNATTWGTALPFLVKMVLVVVSVVTLLPIRTYVLASDGGNVESAETFASWPIASILAWAAAVTAGRMLAYLVVYGAVNFAHLHLVMNHVPTIGSVAALGVLLLG